MAAPRITVEYPQVLDDPCPQGVQVEIPHEF
jgi:hypothetical protein